MDAIGGLRLLAVSMAFIAAALCLPEGIAWVRRARAASRVEHAAMAGEAGLLAKLLRNGVVPATALAHKLCGNRRIATYCDGLCFLTHHRGYETTGDRVGGIIILVAASCVLLGGLVTSSPVFGAMSATCVVLGFGIAAHQAHERQLEEMRESIPDMLHAMSACFHAGYSLLQAFKHLAEEMHGPLGLLFQKAAGDLQTGRTAAEALERLREHAALPELAFVTAALEIQHQTGGSMQKILDSACESVEGELALQRSLRVQTAQARLSMRVVTAMPFILIAVFSLISPGFLTPFFSSGLGLAVFCVATGMRLAGVLIVRRLLDVGEA